MNRIIYIHGTVGSGVTILSDSIENKLKNQFDLEPKFINESASKLADFLKSAKNSIVIVQHDLLNLSLTKSLNTFVIDSNYHRYVIIQSRCSPNGEERKLLDKVYETGLPIFDWVTQEKNGDWTAYSEARGEWKSDSRATAIEFVKNYK